MIGVGAHEERLSLRTRQHQRRMSEHASGERLSVGWIPKHVHDGGTKQLHGGLRCCAPCLTVGRRGYQCASSRRLEQRWGAFVACRGAGDGKEIGVQWMGGVRFSTIFAPSPPNRRYPRFYLRKRTSIFQLGAPRRIKQSLQPAHFSWPELRNSKQFPLKMANRNPDLSDVRSGG